MTAAHTPTSQLERYWDNRFKCFVLQILPGQLHVTQVNEMIATTVGSCVSACIRDRDRNVGGMNHFLLPGDSGPAAGRRWLDHYDERATRFGTGAMEQLINAVLKQGGRRSALEAKIFGGAHVAAGNLDVGSRNVSFVKEYLHTEGIAIVSEDTGDVWPRKIFYSPWSGDAFVKKVRSDDKSKVIERERRYASEVRVEESDDNIQFFD